MPAKKTTVVDTTGAGDILAGVFLGFVIQEKINILEPTKDSLVKIKKGLTIAVDTASRSIEGFGVDHLPYKR